MPNNQTRQEAIEQIRDLLADAEDAYAVARLEDSYVAHQAAEASKESADRLMDEHDLQWGDIIDPKTADPDFPELS